jgi:hypothetical protein
MNILYLGPYRDQTTLGLESLNYLQYLVDGFGGVVSRPIFSEHFNNNPDLDTTLINNTENKKLNNFDILIQHTTIDSVIYTNKIKHLIFIPIVSKKFPNIHQSQKYRFISNKNTIIYSDSISNFIFNNLQIDNTHKISNQIHPNLRPNALKKINLGVYNTMKKYYTIVDDQSSEESIFDLITQFILHNYSENNCLLLFLQNLTRSLVDTYQKFIQVTYSKLGIGGSLNKIVTIPIPSDIQTFYAVHNTGDIYVKLNDNFQQCFTKFYNKQYVAHPSQIALTWPKNDICRDGCVSYTKSIDFQKLLTHNEPSTDPTIIDIIQNAVK